jgi:hypothetical protein
MNNELEWIRNGAVVAYLRRNPGICLAELWKTRKLREPAEMQTAHVANKRRVATAPTFPVRAHVCVSAIYNFCIEHFSAQMRLEKYKSSYLEAGNAGVQVGQSQQINFHVKF